MIPLSLYIHFPWCIKKCPYCDFNSHEAQGEIPEAKYVEALEQDLIRDLAFVADREISTIFMGGGTPSLFSPVAIESMMLMLKKHLTFAADIEITMEANPGTTDYDKFSGYYQSGVNRLSLGVQSFANNQLNLLGRIHSQQDVYSAFEKARKAGFDNINLDLMHGLSEQNISAAMADLDSAIDLNPEHISWYQLTIEPNTHFYKRPPSLPDEDTLWDIYENGIEKLASAGYQRYEVSAFAKLGRVSRHNVNYWQFGDYLGIGAGAHGKQTKLENGRLIDIVRSNKSRLPKDYLIGQKAQRNTVIHEEILLEFLMNSMRLVNGCSFDIFQARTGLAPEALDDFIQQATTKGLVTSTADGIKPTAMGMQYLNEMLMLA